MLQFVPLLFLSLYRSLSLSYLPLSLINTQYCHNNVIACHAFPMGHAFVRAYACVVTNWYRCHELQRHISLHITHSPLQVKIMILSYRSEEKWTRETKRDRERKGEREREGVGGGEMEDERGTRVNREGRNRNREILEVIPQGLKKYNPPQQFLLSSSQCQQEYILNPSTLLLLILNRCVCVCVRFRECVRSQLPVCEQAIVPCCDWESTREKKKTRECRSNDWISCEPKNVSPCVSAFISNVLHGTWLPR